ncbi:hypothetical protein ACTFIR_012199 [Dictyostelium discoideum]
MKIKLLFIFILSQFFCNSIKATEHVVNGDLIKYPSASYATSCSFYFSVVLTNLEQEVSRILIEGPFYSEGFYPSKDKKTVILKTSKGDLPFGNTTLNFSALNSSNLKFYSFNVTCSCNKFNLTNYKVIPLSSGFQYSSLFIVFKIINFPEDILLWGNSNVGDIMGSRYLGNNNYYLQFNSLKSIAPAVNTSIMFLNNEWLSFMFDLPLQINTYTEIESLEYYPSNNYTFKNNMLCFGDLKLKTNSSNLLMTSNYTPPFKVGGNNIDEVLYLIPFYSLAPYTFSIKIQNGASFIEKYINFDLKYLENKMVVVNLGSYQSNGEYTSLEGVEIKNISNLDYIYLSVPPKMIKKQFSFPFGFIGGNSNKSFLSLSFLSYQSYVSGNISIQIGNASLGSFQTSGSTDVAPPLLLAYEISISNYNTVLFKLKVSDNQSGIKLIQSNSALVMLGESLVSGDSLNATLEFRFPFDQSLTSIILCDNALNCNTYSFDSYYFLQSPNIVSYLKPPNQLFSIPKEFDISNCILDISFKYNDLAVTDKSIANVMYLDMVNFPTDRDFIISFVPNPSISFLIPPTSIATYNIVTKKFECEFIVPANINIGPLQYYLTFNSFLVFSFSLPNHFQLNIKESLYADLIGPIATKVSKYQNGGSGGSNVFGWEFSFENDINGYNEGYILVRGSIDMAIRNITGVLSSGTIFNGTYSFSVNISITCISQTYSIVYAKFVDTQGQQTVYKVANLINMISEMIMNPFYRLIKNDESFTDIDLVCDPSLLSSAGTTINPSLLEFTISKTVLEVFSIDRNVTLNYNAYHPDGLLDSIHPIIYLSSYDQEFITGIQSTTMTPKNSTVMKYITTIEVPIGFGYPGGIIVSCFGFISNAGTHSGFTSNILKKSGFQYKINSANNSINVILTGNSELSSNGGKLIIYGRFLSSIATVTVKYNNRESVYTPMQLSDTQFLLDSISASDYYITITAKTTSGASSSSLIVYPKLFKNTTLPKPSPTPTPTPPTTPTPTTIKCKTTCGESNKQGYCSVAQAVCICYSPWIGVDCQSQIVTVPPPKINETNPSTEITAPSTSEIKYSSIVSIVSLRELDYNNNVVNNYTFDKWVFKSISDTQNKKIYSYFSNITINNQVISNITSTLEWNSKASIVQFAGQDISLNPSSIKYTISISKYNFLNQLNTLQLVMSASIQAQNNPQSENDECSSNSFGNSSSSPNQDKIDSNYMQLQVNDHSFYGRFIKRCLLDSRIVPISNSKLDENQIEIKSNNKISSFIGINIPWFSSEAIIDPDFSVLLSHSDNPCNGVNGDSGLTKSQLIGIIVGSVCLFIVLFIIVFYFLLKRCLVFKIFIYKLFKKRKH